MGITFRNMKELKEKTNAVVEEAQRDDVVITSRGKPLAFLRRFEEDELEAVVVLQSPRVQDMLSRALKDVQEGRTVSLEEYLRPAAAEER